MRNVKKSKNYHQWNCFLFKDYEERQGWALTFNTRHLPLSNGDPANFLGKLPNPECWDGSQKQHGGGAAPPFKKSKKKGESSDDEPMMIWDRETQTFREV